MELQLHCLFDNELYIVVHTAPNDVGEGFEIVNKKTEQSCYLTGIAAESFKMQIMAWQKNVPEESTVEAVLDCYTFLNSNCLVMH